MPDDQAYVVIHEVVHCFQADALGMDGLARCPDWLCEGSAFWAGKRVAEALGYDIVSAQGGAWSTYLTNPGTDLFSRSYDAVGFYGHLEQVGIDPWTVLEPMWQAGDDQRAFGLAIATARDAFMDSWASSQLRLPALGGAWIADGPGIPDTAVHATPTEVSVGGHGQQPLDAPPMTNGLYKVAIDTDVLTVATTGSVRLTDESGHDIVGPNGAFCANGTTCECPAGRSYEGPPITDIDTTAYLALTGGEGGAKAELSGTTMEDLCVFTECPISLSEAADIAGMPMEPDFAGLSSVEPWLQVIADASGASASLRVHRGERVPGGPLDIIEYECSYSSVAQPAPGVNARHLFMWFTVGEPASYLWDMNEGSIMLTNTPRTGPSPFPGQVYEHRITPADGGPSHWWETGLEVRAADSFFQVIANAAGPSASGEVTDRMADASAIAILELVSAR